MEREIQQLKLQIEEKIHHAFLLEHIHKPVIDEHKLFFLQLILNRTSLAPKVKEQLIITTMLVQIALDIHEQIPDDNEAEHSSITINSQLSILAGDYYSGLYYWLLAEIEEREYITLLASAIKQINELKMDLYYMEDESVEGYLDTRKQIESLLIRNIAEHLQVIEEVPIIEEILLTNHIINSTYHSYIQIDKQLIIDKQVNKTKGMIDNLANEENSTKESLVQRLHSVVYQNTSSELD
jgi:heptaprenyl diphosphate synthase